MKRQWFVVVEWSDVFGEQHETEFSCTGKTNAENTIIKLKYRFKHDPLVSTSKIYAVYR